MKPLIEAEGLSRTFRMGDSEVRALDGVSLRVDPGEFVSIVGPSGCGKSTLLQILGLLDRPDAGRYAIDGRDVLDLPDGELSSLRSRHLAFIFQFFNLLPRTSTLRNVELPLLYQGLPHRNSRKRVAEALAAVDLEHRKSHGPAELSGGEQQRVAIARALAARPRLLLADEPTGNLNSAQAEEILDRILELNRKGITVLLVTHDEKVASRAPRRIRMLDGKVITDSGRSTPEAPEQTREAPTGRFRTAFSRKLRESVRSAGDSLRSNALRAGLATLGVVVGTASLIAMMAIGAGARIEARERIEKLGSNLLMLLPDRGGGDSESHEAARLSLEDAAALESLAAAGTPIRGVNAVATLPSAAVSFEGASASARVLGVSRHHAAMHHSPPAFGRFFTAGEDERLEKVCVLGSGIASALFTDPAAAIGKTVKVRGLHFTVAGVLPKKGASGAADLDRQLLIPVRTALKRFTNRRTVSYMEIEMTDPGAEEAIKRDATALLRRRHKTPEFRPDGFKLVSLSRIQEALSGVARTLSVLLGAVAATSLLVGGIGIMNIMLVSVRERTREIGLRKAMGARKTDVLAQFLVESAAIGLIGGVVGIGAGVLASRFAGSVTGWRVVVESSSLLAGAGFSFLTGVLSGFWPAYQAAELEPARALRFE
jgi:macrolide transport system ATP-binding/permease protein